MTGAGASDSKIVCPVCASGRVREFVELLDLPVYCNVLWPTRAQALKAARGDMRLSYCDDCTHIFNSAFDPKLVTYVEDYENSLMFSPRFRAYADAQASHLVEQFGLRGKLVVEIGCGKGDFLKLLCEAGGNRAIGFDPTLDGPEGSETVCGPLTLVRGTYREEHVGLGADLVCCRQVLEHLSAPSELLVTVRRTVAERPRTAVFFEVPNALFTLRDMSIWDLIYEHVSYFTPASLRRAFELAGFDIRDLREDYEGQYLCVEAFAGDAAAGNGHDPDRVAALVADFADEYRSRVERWRARLGELAARGRRAAVWGAGSKGVSFLNAVKVPEAVSCVVDISPRKLGLHVAGTGHTVVAPQALRDEQPDTVIIMNPIYKDEIEQTVRKLGITAEFVAV